MGAKCSLTLNGTQLRASIGDTIVDAALKAGIVVPHDCCGGQCDTCRVTVISGALEDCGTREHDTVLACQATLEGDAVIRFDQVPVAVSRQGVVASVSPLSPDIVEVVIQLNSPFSYLPGQYTKLAFAGFPSRDYSATIRLDGRQDDRELIFHIRRYDNGRVSAALGSGIAAGHQVKVRGPFGNAFLRSGPGRLVLVASSTGWAPIWSIAHAVRLTQTERPMVVVASAQASHNLYMSKAVDWLRSRGVSDIVLTHGGPTNGGNYRTGFPTAHLPELDPLDTVYAAGAPDVVEAVKKVAEAAGARCYSDPFTIAPEAMSAFDRIARFIESTGNALGTNPLSPRPKPATSYAPMQTRGASGGRWRANDSGQHEAAGFFARLFAGRAAGPPRPR
jgi:naphthalene 1,2-dioxygenase ferredoxin reductase component